MKTNVMAIMCLLAGLAACSKDKQVLPCNTSTLLIRFTCDSDLAESDAIGFQLVRDDGKEASFTSSNLHCPGELSYEVAMPTYVEAQKFDVRATPTKMGSPLGEPNVLSGVSLAPGCTAVSFPLTAKGGLVTPPEQEAGVAPDDGGSSIPTERGSKENGLACGQGPDCMSGFCADGVCCDGACKGACQACNLQGSKGQCKPTPDGAGPAVGKMCAADDVATCGFDGKCDGEGACRKWPDGSVCAPGQCEGAGTRGRKSCKAGACAANNDLVCAPFACNAASVSCFAECENSTMCDAGKACTLDPDTNKKSCGKKPLGAVCAAGGECESNNCADGVCCSTKCEGACRSCNLVNSMGECKNLPAGKDDDRKVCKATDASTCGPTGKCDGSGGCSLYSKGAVCLAAKCAGSDGVPVSECDGNGSCVAGRPVACAPFTCSGNSCLTKCTSDDQCMGGTSCVNGSCGLLPNGANCNMAAQCSSNQCVDGVCCNSACSGTCQFCALATAKGICADVAANVDDPRNKCGASATTSCGNNGKCDGKKGCQKWPQGIDCSTRSCDPAANTESPAKQCDGAGTCVTVKQPFGCAPFTCAGNACGTTCSRDDQCVAPNTCVNGLCGKRNNGQPCSSAAQCASNICAQGVCCAGACSGTCKSCAVPGKEGSCENVAAGQDPLNQCDATPSNTCKTTGTCDGGGKCAVFAAGVICAAATCSADSSQEIGSSTCDGGGNCKAPAVITCQGNLICTGANCKGSCSTDADCRNGTKCNAGTCATKLANGTSCSSGTQCSSGNCAGVCCDTACAANSATCTTGQCNSNGVGCQPSPAGTQCGGYTCSNVSPSIGQPTSVIRKRSVCDGAAASVNSCKATSNEGCGFYACANGSDCKTQCSADVDCLYGNYCKGGVCSPWIATDSATPCTSKNQCASRICSLSGKCVECEDSCPVGLTCNLSKHCVPTSTSIDCSLVYDECSSAQASICVGPSRSGTPDGCYCNATVKSCSFPKICDINTNDCRTPRGLPCQSDNECAGVSPVCTNGRCSSSSPYCSDKSDTLCGCSTASDCQAGLQCIPGGNCGTQQ